MRWNEFSGYGVDNSTRSALKEMPCPIVNVITTANWNSRDSVDQEPSWYKRGQGRMDFYMAEKQPQPLPFPSQLRRYYAAISTKWL